MAESKKSNEHRLHSLSIKAKDLDKSCDFYSHVLGLISISFLGGYSQGYLLSRHNYLNVEVKTEKDEPACSLIPWLQFEDVQEVYKRCKDTGVEIVMPLTEQADGNQIAKIRDPDGNVIGISQLGKGAPTLADIHERMERKKKESKK